MLFFLLILYYLSEGNWTQAFSLSIVPNNVLGREDPSSSLSCTCPDQRSIWDIVWSCFATIFACSWVAVHPDIPGPDDGWWKVTFKRLEYMFWTILTPELIILWAARQWFGANALIALKEINNIDSVFTDHKWTMTHAHYLQMGGFTLMDGKTSKGVLSHKSLGKLVRDGKVKFPDISAKEIEDRSKSDGLAKVLVIGQTSWFILQTIARKVRGLSTTKLEVASLAFAAINATIYFFWWDKPFDVRTSVPVYLLSPSQPESDEKGGWSIHPWYNLRTVAYDDKEVAQPEEKTITETVREYYDANAGANSSDPKRSVPSFSAPILAALFSPWTMIKFVAKGLHNLSENYDEFHDFQHLNLEDEPDSRIATHVPKFYAILGDYDIQVNLIVSIIALIFGAIHCAAWDFRFPSVAERFIWQIGAILITSIPAIFLVLIISVDGVLKAPIEEYRHGVKGFIRVHITPFLFSTLLPLYGLARIALLVEALTTLRDLTAETFAVVEWTTFLPHI